MKYLLQIYPPSAREEYDRMPEDERQALVEEYLAIGRSPEVIGGQQLQPIETDTTVRVENGETVIFDRWNQHVVVTAPKNPLSLGVGM